MYQDLRKFPRAYGLPSQWPRNAWQHQLAERELERAFGGARSRLLEPVYALSASKLLLEYELAAQLPSTLNNACRMLALQAMGLAGIPLPEDRWHPIAKQGPDENPDASAQAA